MRMIFFLRRLVRRHAIRQTLRCKFGLEVPPNLRIFQVKVNERAALPNTDRRSFSRYNPPEAKRVLTTARAQCQLTHWLSTCASGPEVLVEPTCARTHDGPLLPRSPYDLVLISPLVRTD